MSKTLRPYSVKTKIDDVSRASLSPYSDFLSNLLFLRGISTEPEAHRFFNPIYERDVHDPFLMKGMKRAVGRILEAIKKKQRIIVYSDYDADGIPAAVAMHDFLNKIEYKNFAIYIPHRHDEGFGLNLDAVETFASEGVSLLITIDCGIADVIPVARARELGIDVIITDHHLPGTVLPDAHTIINPKQDGCEYPEKMLCGAGVIYKVIQALIKEGNATGVFEIKEGWEKWLLDMIGIATMSDMVPLTGENRALAHYGLTVLRKSPRPGLMKLLSIAGTSQRYLTEDDIGFTISPRINAASRMGVPRDAFELFSTKDEVEADQYARHLDKINQERKGVVAALSRDVKKILSGRDDHHDSNVVVVGNPDWKPALLGLVANACAEEYKKPFFVWGRDGDGIIKGSCRSGGSAHLLDLMNAVKQGVFIQFGGHAGSGGFTVVPEAIHDFENHLNDAYRIITSKERENSTEITVDMELPIEMINWSLYDEMKQLAPFGTGNPKPLFAFPRVVVNNTRQFGKEGNHLEVSFDRGQAAPINAIGFFMSPQKFKIEIRPGATVTLIGHVDKSVFRGRPELRIRIIDIL